MKIQIALPVCLSVLALALFCGSCSKGPSPHLKRGDDWLKMSDYTQAASEFSQAVTDEPSNVEGHVGVIKSLLGLHRYDEALNEIDVVKKLDPTGSRAAELTKLTEDSLIQLFNSSNSGMTVVDAINKLDLLRKIGSNQSVFLLKTLMGNSSVQLATKAESVLQTLSPSDVESALNALLDSSNTEVKTRTAKRLWKEKGNEKAGKVLLAIAEAGVTSAGRRTSEQEMSDDAKQAMERGLENMDELGYGLAKEFYKKVIISSESYRWELITACIKKIAAANDSGMKDNVVEMLRNHYLGDVKTIVGYSPAQEALEFLANIGDKSFVPELKAVLGYYFPFYYDAQNKCPPTVWLLSKMDGKKWDSFHYIDRSVGGSDFDRLRWGIDQIQNQQDRPDRSVVDHSPEDGDSILRFVQMRGRDGLSINKVDILDADRMKWFCSVYEGDSKNLLYEVDIIFRGTGIGERPWLVTKIENVRQKSFRIGGSADAFLESGKARFNQKDYEGAIADYNKGLLWRPQNNDLLRNRGWAESMKGDYDVAIADAESAVKNAGSYGDVEACLLYGYAKLRKGDYDGAITQFDSMIDRGQKEATCYNWRGIAKEKKGDIDGAVADYRRAIDVNPNLKNELLPKIENALANKK